MTRYRKLRILVLTYEGSVPPKDVQGCDLGRVDWKLEYDVFTTLKKMGQEVDILGVGGDLGMVRDRILEWKPDIVFNLLEEFEGEVLFDQNVVSFLELLGVPYTGCNSRGLMLARDKALAKQVLSFHGIRVPDFFVVPRGRRPVRPKNLDFPLIVKSVIYESSIGISQSSVVYDEEKLAKRVEFIHQSVGADALVEAFIDGRELYVGVYGNQRIHVLPVWELSFEPQSPRHQIATYQVKWNPDYRNKHGIESEPANLPPVLDRRIKEICKMAYRALRITGYARMDLRLNAKEEIFLLEANPNPHIGKGEEFADSGQFEGISYPDQLWTIINLGLQAQRVSKTG